MENFVNTDRYFTQCQFYAKSWFWKGGSTTPSGFTVLQTQEVNAKI